MPTQRNPLEEYEPPASLGMEVRLLREAIDLLKESVETLTQQYRSVDNSLRGDGQGREGIVAKVADHSRQIRWLWATLWTLAGAFVTAIGTLATWIALQPNK